MKQEYRNEVFDQERALYAKENILLSNCQFQGEADGESCLKEASHVTVKDSLFALRYPLWHVNEFLVLDSSFRETSRAPIWYSKNGTIESCVIESIKPFRQCEKINVVDSKIHSEESFWKSSDVILKKSELVGDYCFLESRDLQLEDSTVEGKYGFQYAKNIKITNSKLETKDAFWHSENIEVKDSTVSGAYLAWYSKDITFINCTIIGTQPFCYCENLKLVDCKMIDTDLSFEYSTVDATIIGHVDSIKNPKSGTIVVDSIGEYITTNSKYENRTSIKKR